MYTYQEVINKIQNARRFGKLPGVEVTRVILQELDHPERDIPFVHVAGTNGKGSTCSFLGSIMAQAGYRVGIFTSPHLIDFEERITINGEMIPKEDVERLGNRLLSLELAVSPTMFDYCLAIAILYFKEQNCDLVILETGLGGTKDSTNAVGTPMVTIITKIGYDHTEILGDTLAAIASEKAGIIKKDTVLVVERQEEEALQVILEQARRQQICQSDICLVKEKDTDQISKCRLGMKGTYQIENAAAAVLAANALEHHFPKLREYGVIEKGLASANWRGRVEILSLKPFLLVDGAHNGHGVQALKESLEEMYPGEQFHFIMGVMADKDYIHMIELLLPLAKDFTTVTPDSSRALQAKELADLIEKSGIKARCAENINEIWEHLDREEKNIAFGSLYFIGELLSVQKRRGAKNNE